MFVHPVTVETAHTVKVNPLILGKSLHMFKGSATESLPDENECASGSHRCDVNARCGNVIGSYFCQCYQGFNGDGHTCYGEDRPPRLPAAAETVGGCHGAPLRSLLLQTSTSVF